jgi:DedD protein
MPPDLPNEQELILKKRARRRLVGAIALVLLMIIILPRILQDRANLVPQEAIKITMPEQQADTYSSSVVPVAPEVAVNPQVAEVANEVSEAKVETENPKPVVKVEKEAVAKLAVPKITEPKATEPKVAEPKATPAPTLTQPKATDSFTVQVGVYSDIANVKQLQEKLKQAGYASRTEKVTTPNGEKIRLRAGKFASRQEATTALSKIKAAGLSGMVISHE